MHLLRALSAAAFVLVAPAIASAYCRTSTTSADGNDGHVCYPATDTDSGEPLYWGMPRITYSIQKDGTSQIPIDEVRTAARAAFDTWMAADCDGEHPRVEVVTAEDAECAKVEYNSEAANANVLFFLDQGWEDQPQALALTIVSFNTKTAEIYDADMMFNTTDWQFSTEEGSPLYDLLSVTTHEAGHFLGLAHTPVPEATMIASYSAPWESDLRSLADDDEKGICAIFPPGEIAETCDPTPRHGFSPLCAADQQGPIDDQPPLKDRCCCTNGAECVEGLCTGGCACATAPPPQSPGLPADATLFFGGVAALLLRSRAARNTKARSVDAEYTILS